MRRLALLSLLAASSLGACLCSPAPVTFPCTDDDDCANELGYACLDGVCARLDDGGVPAPREDGGSHADGGAAVDGGVGLDASSAQDAGPLVDAAASVDASVALDAGIAPALDGGADGGDGGIDDDAGLAPALDAGDDGGDDGGEREDAGARDAGPELPADWWDARWRTRWTVTVDASGIGEALASFPVPVILDGAAIDYDRIAAGGADLRFVDVGAVLPYEIERWVEGGGSVVWVRFPDLPSSGTRTIHLYAGRPGVSPPPASWAPSVWSNNFAAVFHLDGDVNDSTSAALTGVDSGSVSATGAIGRGRLFSGAEAITVGPDTGLLRNVQSWTLSAFARPDNPNAPGEQQLFGVSIGAAADTGASRAALLIDGPTKRWEAGGRAGDGEGWSGALAGAFPTGGALVHIAARARYSSDEVELFVDGVPLAIDSWSGDFLASRTSDTPSRTFAIGAEDDGASSFFQGLLDEVRVAPVWRSDGWLRAEARARQPGFVTLGSEETY